MTDLSIVIPAYNEALRLPATLAAWDAFLASRDGASEVIVVDDGSRDDTRVVAEAFAAGHDRFRVVAQPANRGKGAAVRAGMLAATGAYRFYVDADMNIAPENIDRALAILGGGADAVIARRSLADYASTERSFSRVGAGALVQVTRRTLVLPTITDTQAGFKGFRAALAERIFRLATVDGFAFDIEVLYLARRAGARIVQMPVRVEYREGSTFDVRKHLRPFLGDIVRVRRNALARRYR